MSEKLTQRRRPVVNERKTNENIISATKKRKQHRDTSSRFNYLFMKNKRLFIYFILSVIVLFSLYKILIGFIFVEYTNVPINLPKLVNADATKSERFWGTYR